MSLGLNDLNKKKPAKKKVVKEKYPAGAWARSQTARPWTQGPLTKSPQRKKVVKLDGVMNDETFRVAPFFWIDLKQTTWLNRLHLGLAKAERQVQISITRPFKHARRFIGV